MQIVLSFCALDFCLGRIAQLANSNPLFALWSHFIFESFLQVISPVVFCASVSSCDAQQLPRCACSSSGP